MHIDSSFPGGRALVIAGEDPSDIRLSIPADTDNDRFRQWFAFDLRDAAGVRCQVSLVNAGECTWARSFGRYRVCASHDGKSWFRVPTEYDGTSLRFTSTPETAGMRFAYFAPYAAARLSDLKNRAIAAGARCRTVATSVRGQPIPLLEFGRDDPEAPRLWIIAQQHPGEPMGGWFMEGLASRLMTSDHASQALLGQATVLLVPRMNPDGCEVGNHRTNAAGIDLNRQWAMPSAQAPEVAGVRAAMFERGVDLFLDVHGDELLPYVFAQGTEGIPHRTARLAELEAQFSAAMLVANTDFQTEHSYPKDEAGKANLQISTNYVAETFQCLSLTLEMPFSDNANAPEPLAGWSPERSIRLGADTVEALFACVAELRQSSMRG